jgi:hypothetical protein
VSQPAATSSRFYPACVNRGNKPARLAIVLLDAKPLGIGHPRLRGDQVK